MKGFTTSFVYTDGSTSTKRTKDDGDTDNWKLYQTDGGNHPYRPVFGVRESEPHKIYRITTTYALFIEDSTRLSNFYDYDVKFGRYRAISLQPGGVAEAIDSLDHSKLKIIILNLRKKIVEKRVQIASPGCGDGKYNPTLGFE